MTKTLTARFTGVQIDRKNRVAYAIAKLSTGGIVSAVGLSDKDDPTGKYDAMWDLARMLSKFEIALID